MDKNYSYGIMLVLKYIKKIFPQVDASLAYWSKIATKGKDNVLVKQALASIGLKKFHAQGGSVYALYPKVDAQRMVKFIVAFQTISDYLDNLCDRAGVKDESAFRQLHLAMLDAVDPLRDINNYYYYYPYKDDGGYLEQLVNECREQVKGLPSYNLVIEYIKKYIHLYVDLQTYKHLSLKVREECLKVWASYYMDRYPDIDWWEFAAATGSTLGVFVMLASAFDESLTPENVAALDHAYFPWICGLHILLDYYIDSQEDIQMGDLNFTNYYKNLKQCEERLAFFSENALNACSKLQYKEFHLTVVKGLLAMYLSDPKAYSNMNRLVSKSLIKRGGKETTLYYHMCRMLRAVKTLA
ncbi:MAG TPA: tetraprenyl-beta-curcumene synthase family protein [Clostridiaceae bacterium]|nr:tetraprenyl-beta-curcumene synthase family protein [Clostridiaceae bacterium]